MSYRYATAYVFTDCMYHGNPIAVILDAGGLSAEQMQAIACEFQLRGNHIRPASTRCGPYSMGDLHAQPRSAFRGPS